MADSPAASPVTVVPTERELVRVPAFEEWPHSLQHWIAAVLLRGRFHPWRTPQECWELALRDAVLSPLTPSKPSLYGFSTASPLELLYPFADGKADAWDHGGRPLTLDFLVNYCNTPAEAPARLTSGQSR